MQTSKSVARLRALRDAVGRTAEVDGEDREEGFTLIELMVVLLIMAILLAIAIPTFLGVTGGAKRTAAQSNLTNSVTAAQAIYTNGSAFPTTTTTAPTTHLLLKALRKTQTTITFQSATVTMATSKYKGKNAVGVISPTTSLVIMVAQDAATVCWVAAVNQSSTTISNLATGTVAVAPGDHYFGYKATTTNKCTAAAAAKKTLAKWKPNFATIKTLT